MLDFAMQLSALIPTRPNDNAISMPQVRRVFLVRERWRGFNSTLSLWTAPVPVSGTGGRHYCDVLRGAGARYNVTGERDENTQVSHSGSQRLPGDNQDRGDSEANWIKRERNGVSRSHIDGQGVARTGRGPKRAVRWVDLAIDSCGSKTIRNRQRSR